MAATQRPVAELAFSEPTGTPAWKHLPSWAVVATEDKAAGTDLIRSMAERAGATITEVEGSHVIMVSQPEAVTDVILQALAVTSSHGDQSWAEAVYEAYIANEPVYRQPRPRDGTTVVRRRQADRRWPPERRLRRCRPCRRPRGRPSARLAVRHPQLRRGRPVARRRRGYRVLVPYLRGYGTTTFLSDDTLPQRRAGGAGRSTSSPSWTPSGSRARSWPASTGAREPRTSSRRSGPSAARARLGERLPDRQPGSRQAAVAAGGRASVVVPVLLRDRTRPGSATASTAATSTDSSGRSPHRSGTSTMRRSTAPRRPSTTPITSRSSSTTTAGGWGWPKAKPEYAELERRLAEAPSSRCPRSRSRATRTAPRIRSRAPTLRSSRARTAPDDRGRDRTQPSPGGTRCFHRRRGQCGEVNADEFVPRDFEAPRQLETPQFVLEPLGPERSQQDYRRLDVVKGPHIGRSPGGATVAGHERDDAGRGVRATRPCSAMPTTFATGRGSPARLSIRRIGTWWGLWFRLPAARRRRRRPYTLLRKGEPRRAGRSPLARGQRLGRVRLAVREPR